MIFILCFINVVYYTDQSAYVAYVEGVIFLYVYNNITLILSNNTSEFKLSGIS